MTDMPPEFSQWGPRQRWRWILRNEPVMVTAIAILAIMAAAKLIAWATPP